MSGHLYRAARICQPVWPRRKCLPAGVVLCRHPILLTAFKVSAGLHSLGRPAADASLLLKERTPSELEKDLQDCDASSATQQWLLTPSAMANATLSNANTANLTMYQVDLQHDIPQTILSACSCLHAQSLEDACRAIDLLSCLL